MNIDCLVNGHGIEKDTKTRARTLDRWQIGGRLNHGAGTLGC